MNKEVLIVGAGKIGRGFIGQLFFRSNYKLWFVDATPALVDLLNKDKKYRVDIAREDVDETEYIKLEGAFTLSQKEEIENILNRISIMVSCVGAGNIDSTAAFFGELFEYRNSDEPLNWLICENASSPANRIRKVLEQNCPPSLKGFISNKLGLIETQVLRTGMEAIPAVLKKEPSAVRMQDWWTLPFDKDAFIGSLPEVTGLVPKTNFKNELTRKLYTFNGTNGPISYIGWANGYKILHESALAFRDFFDKIQLESAYGLVHEFNLDEKEQVEFMGLAMKKYTDPALNDSIERNARDLKRKVSKKERLIGPALLCLKHGKLPVAYAKAIAAAYHYDGSDDEGTKEVLQTIKENGIEEAVKKYSELEPDNELFRLVIEAYNDKSFILKN